MVSHQIMCRSFCLKFLQCGNSFVCFISFTVQSKFLKGNCEFLFQQCVYVASDGGRVCRPLVIADKGVSRIKECHMKELRV